MDGNVIRVYSRLFLLKGNLKTGAGNKKVWEIAEKLVSPQNPGDFNQALMELGATVCLPEDPLCLVCPLLQSCGAAREGLQNALPESPKAKEAVEVPMAAVYAEKGAKVLVRKRPQAERWLQGMWEFPSAQGKTLEKARRALERDLKVGIEKKGLLEVRHQITHHKIRLRLFKTLDTPDGNLPGEFRWVSRRELASLPFASAQGKLRKWILNPGAGNE